MKNRIQKLVKAFLATATIALATASFSANAFQYSYQTDGWGNHLLYVQNTSYNKTLYCQIRGSNGTWGNGYVSPGGYQYFNIYGAYASAWRCWYN